MAQENITNWSLATNTGKNLLSPGKTPKNNLRFLTFFINTIKAVNDNADLMRAAIASAGNDHRLGANEAPPAIISVFIGTTLTHVLDELEDKIKKGSKMDELEKSELKLDIHNKIPDLMLDNTDRNRTSPFAFTGNKFEFRAVGSSANCGLAMTILNAIVGAQLIEFKKDVEDLVKEGEKRDGAILRVLRRYVADSRRILFEGDNYSKEWEDEAAKRGLSNVKTTPHALDFFNSKEAHKVLVETGIYSQRELHARYDVWQEQYQRKIDIEAGVLTDMILSQVIPAAVKYQQIVAASVRTSMDIGYTAQDFST
jgi:glutamine synthetase